ncbi:MAG: hypothetical protein IPP33_12190 [Flavobacteriales bacterium]|nr:hypothetical protein [Flavobacteriales bacterium]
MDWIDRKVAPCLATLVYDFRQEDFIFSYPILSDNCACFFSAAWFSGHSVLPGASFPVSAAIASMMEKYHFSCSPSHGPHQLLFEDAEAFLSVMVSPK